MSDDTILETLELYIEMTEKQDDIIHHMSAIIARQATELAQMRNLMRVEQAECRQQPE